MNQIITLLTNLFNLTKVASVTLPGLLAAGGLALILWPALPVDFIPVVTAVSTSRTSVADYALILKEPRVSPSREPSNELVPIFPPAGSPACSVEYWPMNDVPTLMHELKDKRKAEDEKKAEDKKKEKKKDELEDKTGTKPGRTKPEDKTGDRRDCPHFFRPMWEWNRFPRSRNCWESCQVRVLSDIFCEWPASLASSWWTLGIMLRSGGTPGK